MSWDSDASYYQSAAVCRRGHVLTGAIEDHREVADRCTECGAPVLTACPDCGHRIRDYFVIPEVTRAPQDRPSFCDKCGAAFPWVGRTERLYELENVMEQEEGLDEATKL
jgi:hypothetical protein